MSEEPKRGFIFNGNGKEVPKLKPKEKVQVIRDIMIKYPRVERYGYNRKIIEIVKDEYGIVMRDSQISKIISEIDNRWSENKTEYVSKRKLMEMYLSLFEETDSITDKRKILQEIGKLENHYIDITKNINEISELTKSDLENLLKDADIAEILKKVTTGE